MYTRKIPLDLNCGVSIAMEVIISKWKFHILYKVNNGINRPKDMLEAIPDITKRVLLHQLKQLETYKIVYRITYNEVPLRTEYFLTKEGKRGLEILNDLNKWGQDFRPKLEEICKNEL